MGGVMLNRENLLFHLNVWMGHRCPDRFSIDLQSVEDAIEGLFDGRPFILKGLEAHGLLEALYILTPGAQSCFGLTFACFFPKVDPAVLEVDFHHPNLLLKAGAYVPRLLTTSKQNVEWLQIQLRQYGIEVDILDLQEGSPKQDS